MRKLKKLALSRETLRNLGVSVFHKAAGGYSAACTKITACIESCPCQPTPPPNNGPIETGPFYQGCPSYGDQCTVAC